MAKVYVKVDAVIEVEINEAAYDADDLGAHLAHTEHWRWKNVLPNIEIADGHFKVIGVVCDWPELRL
jgi:hypothetical protein